MELTEDEAAVYDRQLRVWGVKTQRKCVRSARPAHHASHHTLAHARLSPLSRRLTSARVLVLNCTGVAAEARGGKALRLRRLAARR
jgi:molybdopterin/thiamine biosynthesis adenylyltransferase